MSHVFSAQNCVMPVNPFPTLKTELGGKTSANCFAPRPQAFLSANFMCIYYVCFYLLIAKLIIYHYLFFTNKTYCKKFFHLKI